VPRPLQSSSTGPRTTLLGILVTLLASVAVLVGFAQPAAAQEPRLRITLDSVTPFVTPKTKSIRITGRVTNSGDVPLSTLNAMLWFDENPLTTREQLQAAATERPGDRLGQRIVEPFDQVTDVLRPGKTARFEVSVPVDTLDFSQSGIYPIGIDVRATIPYSGTRDTWRARSLLPYIAKGTKLTPVEVAFLLPLTGQPNLVSADTFAAGLGGRTAATTREGLPNPHEFGPNGRLSRLIELGSAHDLTFVVDPELLAEAERMSDGYRLTDDTKVGADETTDVRRWLNRARGVLNAGHTLMLPYADPDLPALERERLNARYGEAVRAANRAVKNYGASGTIVWPGSGYADAGVLETIASTGVKTVILAKDALPDLPDDGSSPVASLSTPDGALTAIVVDPALTSGMSHSPGSTVNIQQRFLAETALLAMKEPRPNIDPADQTANQRRVVAAMPRTWDPGAAGGRLFSTVESTSWLRPVSAAALLSQPPTQYGGPLARSAADERSLLDSSVVEELREFAGTSDTVLDLLAEPEKARSSLDLAFLRGASTAWRRHPDAAKVLIDTIDADVQNTVHAVSIVRPRPVTLSSRSGRLPVTIWNQGDLPVEVQLEVRPTNPERLKVMPIEPVRVDPDQRVTVRVTAETSGTASSVQMEVGLATRSGTRFGKTESFQVLVRGYGQFGWLVIGAGLGLLALGAAVRITRRIRAAIVERRSGTGDAGGTATPEAGSEARPTVPDETQASTTPDVTFGVTPDLEPAVELDVAQRNGQVRSPGGMSEPSTARPVRRADAGSGPDGRRPDPEDESAEPARTESTETHRQDQRPASEPQRSDDGIKEHRNGTEPTRRGHRAGRTT